MSQARTIPEEFLHQIDKFIDGTRSFFFLEKWVRDHFQDLIAIEGESLRKLVYEIEASAHELREHTAREDGIRKTLAALVSKYEPPGLS